MLQSSYILWRFSDIKFGKGSFMTEVERINETGLITSLKKPKATKKVGPKHHESLIVG